MKNKVFGINIGTILTAAVCLVTALSIWIYVEFVNAPENPQNDEEACDVG